MTSFFAALSDAGEQLKTLTDPAVEAVSAATQLRPDLLRTVLPQFDFTLQLPPALPGKLDELARWAESQGKIKAGTPLPDYATLIDNRFLPVSE
ncbi:hypothetical protein [Nocardia fluminea]|uniref:hypothetical protein n=1 Tax=Nocardia fluminea TaxID=134984 RepID=UPI00365AD5E1